MDAETADAMRDTIAFIRARHADDFEAAKVLLDANKAGIIMGLVDMNLAYAKLTAERLLGVTVEYFLDSLTTVGGWITNGAR